MVRVSHKPRSGNKEMYSAPVRRGRERILTGERLLIQGVQRSHNTGGKISEERSQGGWALHSQRVRDP